MNRDGIVVVYQVPPEVAELDPELSTLNAQIADQDRLRGEERIELVALRDSGLRLAEQEQARKAGEAVAAGKAPAKVGAYDRARARAEELEASDVARASALDQLGDRIVERLGELQPALLPQTKADLDEARAAWEYSTSRAALERLLQASTIHSWLARFDAAVASTAAGQLRNAYIAREFRMLHYEHRSPAGAHVSHEPVAPLFEALERAADQIYDDAIEAEREHETRQRLIAEQRQLVSAARRA